MANKIAMWSRMPVHIHSTIDIVLEMKEPTFFPSIPPKSSDPPTLLFTYLLKQVTDEVRNFRA